MTITEFLEARIAEDEKLAEAASVSMHGQRHTESWDYASYVLSSERDATEAQDKFITEWWPARVLAECAAKRAIIAVWPDLFGAWTAEQAEAATAVKDHMRRALAAAYADHTDFRQEWKL